jgi:hypothetical protein
MSPQALFFQKKPKINIDFQPKNQFFIGIFRENSIEHTLTSLMSGTTLRPSAQASAMECRSRSPYRLKTAYTLIFVNGFSSP